MNQRTSSIQNVRLVELVSPSVFEIGDSKLITPASKAIAVQRERAIFPINEFNFSDFSIFSMTIPQPTVNEPIEMTTINESPIIEVGNIDLFSITASSIVHLGSSQVLQADSRVKHIRHLFRERKRTDADR